MYKINSIEDLKINEGLLPKTIREDVNKRISDWLSMDGNVKDDYIIRQFRYAEECIERWGKK